MSVSLVHGRNRIILKSVGFRNNSLDINPATEQITPSTEDSEFVYVPFRMLSCVIVDGYFLDFSKDDVLASAVEKFNHVTIYADHNPSVHNWLGVTLQPSFSTEGSAKGINAIFKIDKIKAPMVARGLSINPPAIKACSVGIEFNATQSHPEFKGYEFRSRLGEVINNELVRWIVTDIVEIFEVSLVYSGADPNAKKLSYEGLSMDIKEQRDKIIAVFGLNPDSDFESNLEKINEYVGSLKDSISALEKRLEKVSNIFGFDTNRSFDDNLKAVQTEYVSNLASRDSAIMKERSEALRAYTAFVGSNINPAITRIIEFGDLESVVALKKEYQLLLEYKFPKNADGVRRSSVGAGENVSHVDFQKFSI